MQIVIDIDEKTYDDFMYYWVKDSDILRAVRNGTPLPKGHGRLIIEKDGEIHEESQKQKFL